MADREEVIQIEVASLQANPLQPRGLITAESLVDLVDSIREHGILEPLVVAKTPAGFQIIAGERRWRAAKLAGLETVPAVIRETTPRGMLEMALVENVQREDLNALERATAFQRLIEEFNLSNSEIAQRIGKSPAFVSNSLRLLTLPDALKDGLLTEQITEGHARALAAIDDAKIMVEAYKIILRTSGSVRKAEDLARRLKKKTGRPPRAAPGGKPTYIVDEAIDRLRDEIEAALRHNELITKVKLIRSRAETRLEIVFKGGLKETEGRLQKVFRGITGKS